MTSQLNIDTIKGKSTAGSITTQGEGSATTNLQQGLAKSWLDLDGTAADSTADLTGVRDSFNLTSVVDNGTGSYSPTFTNNMGSANYSTPSTVGNEDDAGALIMAVVTKTTSTYRVDSESSSSNNDANRVDVAVLGDLA